MDWDFTVIIQHGPARTGSARASHGPPPAANRPVTGPPQARPGPKSRPLPLAHGAHGRPARPARTQPVRPGTPRAQARPQSSHTPRTGLAGPIRLRLRLRQTQPARIGPAPLGPDRLTRIRHGSHG